MLKSKQEDTEVAFLKNGLKKSTKVYLVTLEFNTLKVNKAFS